MKVAITPTSKLAIHSFVSMGMPCVDGIPRSSPHSSVAYHPATTKRSQLAVDSADFACDAELDSFPVRHRPVAHRRVRAGHLSQWAVVSAVVAILASAGLETDYHPRMTRG